MIGQSATGGERPFPVAVILGATAAGKSDLAAALARRCNGEIVSADSMQVYRGFDIGTAKPSRALRAEIPHHVVGIVEAGQDFSMGDFVRAADAAIHDIVGRGKLPIVAGGTGLYIRGLLLGPFDGPGRDEGLRSRLRRVAERRGWAGLHRWLVRVDPGTAARVGPNDPQRLVRALEIWILTGRPLSDHLREGGFGSDRYRAVKIGLLLPVLELDRRIAARSAAFFANGLVEEVRALVEAGAPAAANAFKAIGYREALAVLRGEMSESEAVASTTLATRRYAKRQRTWFRREPGIHWLDAMRPIDELLAEAEALIVTGSGEEATVGRL